MDLFTILIGAGIMLLSLVAIFYLQEQLIKEQRKYGELASSTQKLASKFTTMALQQTEALQPLTHHEATSKWCEDDWNNLVNGLQALKADHWKSPAEQAQRANSLGEKLVKLHQRALGDQQHAEEIRLDIATSPARLIESAQTLGGQLINLDKAREELATAGLKLAERTDFWWAWRSAQNAQHYAREALAEANKQLGKTLLPSISAVAAGVEREANLEVAGADVTVRQASSSEPET